MSYRKTRKISKGSPVTTAVTLFKIFYVSFAAFSGAFYQFD